MAFLKGAGNSWTPLSEWAEWLCKVPFYPWSVGRACSAGLGGDPSHLEEGCCFVLSSRRCYLSRKIQVSWFIPLVLCLISEHHLAVWGFFWNVSHGTVSSRWLQLSEGHVHGELFNSCFMPDHNHKVNTQNGWKLTRMCIILCVSAGILVVLQKKK